MKRKLPLLLAALLAAAVAAGGALAASVVPTLIPGSPATDKTCEVQFPGTIEFKVEGPDVSGTHTDGTLSVNIVQPSTVNPSIGASFDFSANFKVVGVIVKDGVDGANKYDYLPDGI